MKATEENEAFALAAIRVAEGASPQVEAASLVATMSLGERLDCLDGDIDFWSGIVDMSSGGYHEHPWPAAAVERLGVPGLAFADGPRGCVVGPATCFPVAMAHGGASFDPALERQVGDAIGAELRAAGATFTGAVCINLLRHPAWGRAQETYGEDPHHVGAIGVAFTEGLQRHVMACVKHFALNSMENARFTVDVQVDDRALHEVYLPHFKQVVDAGVASVMSAYNAVNGSWCGESHELLTSVLRDDWGFDGLVISDFVFGLRDPVASVEAGLDIEMPFRQQRAHALAEAVEEGALAESTIDASVVRTVASLLRFADRITAPPAAVEVAGATHRALARKAATAGAVALTNRDGFLPVDVAGVDRVAVLGPLAAVANLGDGGSSAVHPPETVTLLDGVRAAFPGAAVTHEDQDATAAAGADLVVVVVGYTAVDEGEFLDDEATAALAHLFPPSPERRDDPEHRPPSSEHDASPAVVEAEPDPDAGIPNDPLLSDRSDKMFVSGGDRRSLRLSESDEAIIAAATAASDRVVVVVMSGSTVVMPWVDEPAATLMVWYPGMEGGHSLGDMLTGRAEPGGRLPFAVPVAESDLVPFDPDAEGVTYGLFHGQWWLDRHQVGAHFPFGWGLGYTTWSLGPANAAFSPGRTRGRVEVAVTNEGRRPGSTVVMVFAGLPGSVHARPHRRLVGFAKVEARAGASTTATIEVDLAALAVRVDGAWFQEPGVHELDVGLRAHDPAALRLSVTV